METIEGVYRGGRIELAEQPQDAENTRVLVTFTRQPAPPAATPQDGPKRDILVRELFARMEQGFDFGAPFPTREEIYNERIDQLDRRRQQAR